MSQIVIFITLYDTLQINNKLLIIFLNFTHTDIISLGAKEHSFKEHPTGIKSARQVLTLQYFNFNLSFLLFSFHFAQRLVCCCSLVDNVCFERNIRCTCSTVLQLLIASTHTYVYIHMYLHEYIHTLTHTYAHTGNPSPCTRFIGLGKVSTSKDKTKKWMHALSLEPIVHMSKADVSAEPEGTTECPYVEVGSTVQPSFSAPQMLKSNFDDSLGEIFIFSHYFNYFSC